MWHVVHRSTRSSVGQDDLLDLDRDSLGRLALRIIDGASQLLLLVVALPEFPFAELVLVERGDHQSANQQSEHREPRVQLAQRRGRFRHGDASSVTTLGFQGT